MKEVQVLERIIAKDGAKLRKDSDEYEMLQYCGYLYLRSDEVFIVPEEIKERYLELRGSAEYLQLKKRYDWLYECLNIASYLYILYPLQQLQKLLALEPTQMPPEGTDLRDLLSCLPSAFIPIYWWGDGQLTSCDPEKVRDLLEEISSHERMNFYLPRSAKDIRKGESSLLLDEAGQSLGQRLLKLLGKLQRDKETCRNQYMCILTLASQAELQGKEWEEALDTLLPWRSLSCNDRKKMLHLVTRLGENVRSPYLGGWSLAELGAEETRAGKASKKPSAATRAMEVLDLETFRTRSGRKNK